MWKWLALLLKVNIFLMLLPVLRHVSLKKTHTYTNSMKKMTTNDQKKSVWMTASPVESNVSKVLFPNPQKSVERPIDCSRLWEPTFHVVLVPDHQQWYINRQICLFSLYGWFSTKYSFLKGFYFLRTRTHTQNPLTMRCKHNPIPKLNIQLHLELNR